MMPVLNGIEVLEQLRRHKVHQNIPVLMLTSLRTVGDIKRAMSSGASAYLTKPFRPDEFLKRVNWLLEAPASVVSSPPGDDLVVDV